jgi:hypothetical protein|tara:strand:- start:342 stop:1175 length:834 start_codon:yes stop_codon:yes gene_type:complete
MTRIAKDITTKDEFIVNVFDAKTQNLEDNFELYTAFESGWPVVIKNLTIPNLDYEYYDNLSDWTIPDNKWIMPWYNSHIKKRDRLRDERNWTEEQIDIFHKKHKQSQEGWNEVFDMLFPHYKTSERMLSHRYNTLIENKLHLDELDEQHTGNEQQIRMFVQLDKKRPRVLSFGPNLEQMYEDYYWNFDLKSLDKNNIHKFITEMRDRCVWNDKQWDQFHHPLHYVTFDPGDIWFFNAQWITHQIVFGTKLQCFEADILNESLLKPELCMAERIKEFV